MGDAHAKDVARLTKRIEELEPLAAVAKHNMEEKERAEADAAEWQRVGCVDLECHILCVDAAGYASLVSV